MRCMNTCASTDGARRAQNCATFASVCVVVFMPLFAMCSSMFKLCVRMYAVCRSQMFVNMRCRIHSLYTFCQVDLMLHTIPILPHVARGSDVGRSNEWQDTSEAWDTVTWSHAPIPSMDNAVACASASVINLRTCPTQSVPALVDNANWNGEQTQLSFQTVWPKSSRSIFGNLFLLQYREPHHPSFSEPSLSPT